MSAVLKTYNPPSSPYLDIVYEDKDILVIDKPSGLLSVAGKGDELKDCVEYRARMQFGWVAPAHRLDMPTSGIMVLARNKKALAHISQQFEKRLTKKSYAAWLYGNLKNEQGEIDLPLICDWPNRPKQMVCHERGKKAVTRYKVVERTIHATRVNFTPITGRTHQLRVHAMAIGHTILGDPMYGDEEARGVANRLQLHAQNLGFIHPITDKVMSFSSPAPF